MKINYLIILLILSQLTFSQKKIEYGINGGINYSNFRGNEFTDNFNYDFGFLIGLTVEYSFKKNLSIISGINYERKKSVNNSFYLFNNENPKITDKIDYLTLPVFLKLNFDNHFFINGGSYLSYLISGEYVLEGITKLDQTDLKKRVDFGISFGIGKKFKLNEKNNLNLEIRNDFGIVNISDTEISNNGTIKTNSLNLIMGLTF